MGRIGRYGQECAWATDWQLKSIAFCYMEQRPKRWREVHLSGASAFERIYDGKVKAASFLPEPMPWQSGCHLRKQHEGVDLAGPPFGGGAGKVDDEDNSGVITVGSPLKWQSTLETSCGQRRHRRPN